MDCNDLISRSKLLRDLSYCAPELWRDEEYIKAKIMRQHTVDAVPVVRCKDCKFRDVTGLYPVCGLDSADPCELTRNADEDDWFCADGERRDDDA